MPNQIQLRERASYSYCARPWRQQTNPSRKKNFPSGWKCYKTIGSYISCAFIEIWSTWEVWRALKKLELLSATPRATLTHLSCSPNFTRASYLDERTLTYELTVNYNIASRAAQSNSVYASVLKILMVHADSVSKSLHQKFFFSRERPLLARGKIIYFATVMDTNRDSAHQS